MRKKLTPFFLFFALLCAGGAVYQASNSPPRSYHEVNLNIVRVIDCYDLSTGVGMRGTGWIVSKDTMITAAHVSGEVEPFRVCIDVGTQTILTIKTIDWDNDLTILHADTGDLPFYTPYSCDGFRVGHHYTATGWADGKYLRQTDLEAENWVTKNGYMIGEMRASNLRILKGHIYHGMSGGPIFDDHGVVIGLNTATAGDTSYSRDLRDTVLCGKPRQNPPLH